MRLLIPLVAGALVVCASLGASNSGTEPIQGEEVKLTVRTMSLDTVSGVCTVGREGERDSTG